LRNRALSNIEQQSLEFVKYTLDPWVSRWEQSMRRALLRPEEKKEYFFKFNVDGLLRGDYQSRMNGYATARQNGWMSANDIRELENLDRIPEEEGGDLYLINGNMTKARGRRDLRGVSSNRKRRNSLMKRRKNRQNHRNNRSLITGSGKGGSPYDKKILAMGAKRNAGQLRFRPNALPRRGNIR
jgi:hypothetical protein